MDLNELLYQHQRALIVAADAAVGPAPSRFDLVGHYAARIDRLRADLGARSCPEWLAE